MIRPIQPYWRPFPAGIALGMTLLLTFLLTGHGLNVTGFFTHLTAWMGEFVAPVATQWNAYLGPLLAAPAGFAYWPGWEVAGIAFGGLAASLSANRFRLRVERVNLSSAGVRLVLAFGGGALAGFGARIARGCTSSIGLSGSATLAVAGFLFLGGFFIAGLITSRLILRRGQ